MPAIAAAAITAASTAYAADQQRKASHAQSDAEKAAEDQSNNQFGETRADTAATRNLGNQASNQLASLFGFKQQLSEYDPAVQAEYQKQQTAYNDYMAAAKAATPKSRSRGSSILGGALGGILGPVAAIKHGSDMADPLQLFIKSGGTTDTSGAPTVETPAQIAARLSAQGTSGTPDQSGFNAFKNSTGYQFQLDQALKSVQNSAAARGGLGSGNALRAINDTAQNTANTSFGNYFNQLATMAGLGSSAQQSVGQLGSYNSANVGNYLQNQGVINGSAYSNNANIIGAGVKGIAGNVGQYFGSQTTPSANSSSYSAPLSMNSTSGGGDGTYGNKFVNGLYSD